MLNLVVDQATGERLATYLDEQIGRTQRWIERARSMTQPIPLGTNPVGQSMAEKFRTRADGGPESFVGVIEDYREALIDAKDAVQAAMRDYREGEDERAEIISDAVR